MPKTLNVAHLNILGPDPIISEVEHKKIRSDVVTQALPPSRALLLSELEKLIDHYGREQASFQSHAVLATALNLRALLLVKPYTYRNSKDEELAI